MRARPAAPRGGERARERASAREAFEEAFDKREADKLAKQVAARAAERDEYLAARESNAERERAFKAACRKAGHFGFGFGPDGRPLLHGGYAGMGSK